MNRAKRHEEVLSVTLPGGRLQLATVFVNATDTDEDVCKGISQVVGTIFRISGVSYKLTRLDPYTLKRLDVKKTRELTVDDPPEEVSEVHNVKPDLTPSVSEVLENFVRPYGLPQAGETWKTKDKRRSTTFRIATIEGDFAITEDGRRIQLARFRRYERISA